MYPRRTVPLIGVDPSRTIVFDLGGVLVPSDRVLPVLAAELGVPESAFVPAYWTGRHAFDLGGDTGSYWSGVLGALGRDTDPALTRRLTAIDAQKWATLTEESAALLARLAGERLALLSNAPKPLADAVRAATWSTRMDRLAFSAELGLLKPDPAIYARADEVLDTRPDTTVFFDDRPENVAAAREHGWEAHVWAGAAAALEALER